MKKTKDGWESEGGGIKEAFVDQNGFRAVDLSKSNFKVVGMANKLYTNPRDINPKTNGSVDNKGIMGFGRVQIQFATNDDAVKAGFIYGGLRKPLGWTTDTGTGVYDPDTKRAWVYPPLGHIDKDWGFNQQLMRNLTGQKEANEHFDPFQNDYILN